MSSNFDFSVQTAIKTGLSTDFRDAWAIAYNSKYIVGAWMGNLSEEPMSDINGSRGPGSLMLPILNKLSTQEEILGFTPPRGDQPEVFEPYKKLDSTWQEDPSSV